MNSKNKPALLKFFEENDITLKDLIDTALEFYVPHPGVETKEKATAMISEELMDALQDPNIATLEYAAFKIQEDAEAGRIPGVTQEIFRGRPGLVADELIGIAIATYIAGARGVFEFTRFDQIKPGILKKLGAMTNDAVGGLIAGVSSNMYTRALRNTKTK
jgi:alpha-ribazole phosphatase CobZ